MMPGINTRRINLGENKGFSITKTKTGEQD
jgi:hypothetical protein